MEHLKKIEIRNFRLFDSLDIERVGQVNLITGKNNCGKTTLLEALRIWACSQSEQSYLVQNIINLLLIERGDWVDNDKIATYQSLFHQKNYKNSAIEILEAFFIQFDSEKREFFYSFNENGKSAPNQLNHFKISGPAGDFCMIQANFDFQNSQLWKNTRLTEKEDRVAEILQIIEPRIVRVDIDTALNSAFVRLKDSKIPVPLKNFGEGMNRLLTIALGLVNAENNLLLIDEIDLGLHHSVQEQLWKIVFETAKNNLKMQVFATTHSRDCVKAFSRVAEKYRSMANYIRLEKNKNGEGFRGVIYEPEILETAVYQEMETR